MKKQIAKSLSILSLLVLLSGNAVNVSAGCGRPKCTGPSLQQQNVAAPATTPNVTKLSEQELELSEQQEGSFGFAYFLMRWTINFLYYL